ncbi:unnamed protein product [Ascophyllum nodosum]
MAILCEVSLNKDTHAEREGDTYRQQQQQQNYWYIYHIRSLYLC